jgi:hypothetical protein
MPRKPIDVTGMRFGRLIVEGTANPAMNGRRRVTAVCDCGNRTVVDPRLLRNGDTQSCGCLRLENVKSAASARKSYDVPKNQMPEYNSWLKMRGRCQNKNDRKFPLYGGRGISVCDRWDTSFGNFYADMGPRPDSCSSLDRIDVHGDYEPENCRWATHLEQAQNKQTHRWVMFDGEKMPLSKACRLAGVNYQSARYRLSRGKGWMPLSPPLSDLAAGIDA